jgi:glycosyltransferase involved in cell wall biosynthesis
VSRPSVSVVVPAHDHRDYVAAAIDSILGQTRPADEIVVVDDGSTDGTTDVLARYGDRIRLIVQQNAGIAAAYNRGVAASTGEWIAFVESDDALEPDYLAATCELLANEPAIAWVSTARRIVDERGVATGAVQRKSWREARFTTESLLLHDLGCASTPVVRRRALEDVGPFDGRTWAADTEMALRFSLRHGMAFLDRPLYRYRRHAGNTSASAVRNATELVRVLERFVGEHPELATDRPDLVRRALARHHGMLGATLAEHGASTRAEVLPWLVRSVLGDPLRPKYLRRLLVVAVAGPRRYGRWRSRGRERRAASDYQT